MGKSLTQPGNITEFQINSNTGGGSVDLSAGVVDYRYYERLFLYKETVRQSINGMLQGLGEYIYYIKTLNKRNDNADVSKLIKFQIDIEDKACQLDLLRNKLSAGTKIDTKSLSSYD